MRPFGRVSATLSLVTALSLAAASANAQTEKTEKTERIKKSPKVEESTDWLLWGGVGALGVGAVFVSLGIYESVTIKDTSTDVNDPTFTQYRKRFPSTVSDVCASAHAGQAGSPPASPTEMNEVIRLCDAPNEASHKRTLGYMFYGVGVLSIVIGTTMLLMRPGKPDKEKEATSATIRIEPVFAPNGGGLFVLGRF